MEKGAEAFRSIGEVAKLIGVAPHVLRYWETQFSLLKPVKRGDGRRYYRPDDVRLAAGLCEILRDEGLTIRGARKMLARDRGAMIRARGAARLGEAIGVAMPQDEESTTDATANDAMTAIPAAASSAPRPEPAAILSTQNHIQDHDDDLPHAPRSRERHRRRPTAEPLPLFPDLATPEDNPATPQALAVAPVEWLPRLGALAATLRNSPAPLPRAARKPALHLLDQIAARL
ncbi:MAG: MerR family transcriptional regulator [Paracoccus sp. (in: a-proteobacteria)]|uniref:MerR family transcriptional regulator n=1 Tax=Paracoccus sp. TaxID=267 RepID=UPI0026DF185B|nr:MerR family transcriptional regulator [Paracoccus sp. (in: a-proteobacteria)]MDO5630386.1 MerR family transcriptional regulator [Paracoccus sp. (in: a-proteobacteria)]